MRRFAVAAAMVLTLISCTQSDEPSTTVPQEVVPVAETEAKPEIIAGGTELTTSGGIARRSAADATRRGAPYFISVDVRGASRRDTVEVVWYRPDGKRIRSDRKSVAPQVQHVVFSSGQTRGWSPGRYQAEIFVNGRKAAVREFQLL